MNKTGQLSPAQARRLIRRALDSGVEFCGIHLRHGRPMIGCAINADRATHRMLSRVIEAEQKDPEAINRALWNYVLRDSPRVCDKARAMVMLSGGQKGALQ